MKSLFIGNPEIKHDMASISIKSLNGNITHVLSPIFFKKVKEKKTYRKIKHFSPQSSH